MEKDIKLTVIMPSLNVAPYIEMCIKSVVNQTMQDMEILCIDAGSTDGTLEILEQFKREDSRIRIIHSDKKSYGYQVNKGLALAKGKYVSIVETDDFISWDMYEKLYMIAETHHLDYVKGTYSNFVSLDHTNVFSWEVQTMGNCPQYRDRVIEPRNIPEIYEYDASIWSGIYNRDFLVRNHIFLNESPGAAYQDIGFLQQTIGYAERAWYSSQSFYRYRVDREESSVKSPKGLNFAKGEFERIISEQSMYDGIASKEGLYTRMLGSFLAEFKRILPVVSYDMESEYVKESFLWFKNTLKEQFQDSICTEDKKAFKFIMEDEQRFIRNRRKECADIEEEQNKLCNEVDDNRIVIFGAGIRGGHTLNFLLSRHKNVVAFCDNDKEKLTDKDVSMPILPLHVCIKEFPDAFYVVANKYYSDEIQQQLIDEGIVANRIKVFLQ